MSVAGARDGGDEHTVLALTSALLRFADVLAPVVTTGATKTHRRGHWSVRSSAATSSESGAPFARWA